MYLKNKLRDPEILSTTSKQDNESPRFFQTTSKTSTKGIPEILLYYFKNETQGVLGILSNYVLKNKARDPRFFQTTSKTR